jgi:hypothetical protein
MPPQKQRTTTEPDTGANGNEAPRQEFVGLLTKKQIAPLLGDVSQATISARMADGSLPYIKLGGRVLFDWDSVRAALIRRQRGAQ